MNKTMVGLGSDVHCRYRATRLFYHRLPHSATWQQSGARYTGLLSYSLVITQRRLITLRCYIWSIDSANWYNDRPV